jgi:hypothetical protein
MGIRLIVGRHLTDLGALRVYHHGEMRAVQTRETPSTTQSLGCLVVRLLVVHDEDTHRALLQSQLSIAGFAVEPYRLVHRY